MSKGLQADHAAQPTQWGQAAHAWQPTSMTSYEVDTAQTEARFNTSYLNMRGLGGSTSLEPFDSADNLRAVQDLPAVFRALFKFRFFNPIQSESFDVAFGSDTNMVVSAPTGAGKTGIMELAMIRLLHKHLASATAPINTNEYKPGVPQSQRPLQQLNGCRKVIYLGPIKALVQERQLDWHDRFSRVLGLKVVQLTGDDDADGLEGMETADIICTTPEKFDQVTRKAAEKGFLGMLSEISLVLLDEVHLLNEVGRGSSLEAGCVCRIKAVATLPEMAGAPIASVRFVAVSATIPNISDIAQWLSVPGHGLRQYGDELRPCKLTMHVKGFVPSKNDFLFERRLNDHVYSIVRDYSKGRPALVFCSSRKGTMDAAAAIVKDATAHAQVTRQPAFAGAITGSTFVRDVAQLQRLRGAASSTQTKALGAALVAGVGFHNAAMEPADRQIVEDLFKAGDLAVLCTTSTLAMGVNLPAHLVVLKGTLRWVGDNEALPGEQSGYKEYSMTEVLQMVGRAGRPQFDNEGVAVIMTNRESTNRYQCLLSGLVVESCLLSTLPEHLNAEIVLGTVKDVSQAIAWIKSTFLYTRVRANPQHYRLKLPKGSSEAELDGMLREQIVWKPVQELMKYQLVESDEDSFSLKATAAGRLMAAHFLNLKTMASIVQLGQRPNVPSLLRVICGAEELKNIGLRRSEKKVLNGVNHSKDPEQLRYHVMSSKDSTKVKDRITLPSEKLFILLNDALADRPSDALDYSLRQEQTRVVVIGQRIANCMAKYYGLCGSFSSAGRSLLLSRSLRSRLWEDSKCSTRQLPSVGRQVGARLAAAGLGTVSAIAACGDPHKLEVAAQRPYPWGSELLAALKAAAPAATVVTLKVVEVLPGRRGCKCQLTVSKTVPASTAATAAAAAAATAISSSKCTEGPLLPDACAAGREGTADCVNSSSSRCSPCKLLVGCSCTDELLLLRSIDLERITSPLQIMFKVSIPAGQSEPVNVTAMLLHERLIGFDLKVTMALTGSNSGLARNSVGDSSSRLCSARDSTNSKALCHETTVGGALCQPTQSHDVMQDDKDPAERPAAVISPKEKQHVNSKQTWSMPQTDTSTVRAKGAQARKAETCMEAWQQQVEPAQVTAASKRKSAANISSKTAVEPAKRMRTASKQQHQSQQHWQSLIADQPDHTAPPSVSFENTDNSQNGAPACRPPTLSIAARYQSIFNLHSMGLQPNQRSHGIDRLRTDLANTANGVGDDMFDESRKIKQHDADAGHASTAVGVPVKSSSIAAPSFPPDAADRSIQLHVTPAGRGKTYREGFTKPQRAVGSSCGTLQVQHHSAGCVGAQQPVPASQQAQTQTQLLSPSCSSGSQVAAVASVNSLDHTMSMLFDQLVDDSCEQVQLERHQRQGLQVTQGQHLQGLGSAASGQLQLQLHHVQVAIGQRPEPIEAAHLRAQHLQSIHSPKPQHIQGSFPVASGLHRQSASTTARSAAFGAAVQRSHQVNTCLSIMHSFDHTAMSMQASNTMRNSHAKNRDGCADTLAHRLPSLQQQGQGSSGSTFPAAACGAPLLRCYLPQLTGPNAGATTTQQMMLDDGPCRAPAAAGPDNTCSMEPASNQHFMGRQSTPQSNGAGDCCAAKGDSRTSSLVAHQRPDFSRFAYSKDCDTKSAAFKASANSRLFGHLKVSGNSNSSVQSRALRWSGAVKRRSVHVTSPLQRSDSDSQVPNSSHPCMLTHGQPSLHPNSLTPCSHTSSTATDLQCSSKASWQRYMTGSLPGGDINILATYAARPQHKSDDHQRDCIYNTTGNETCAASDTQVLQWQHSGSLPAARAAWQGLSSEQLLGQLSASNQTAPVGRQTAGMDAGKRCKGSMHVEHTEIAASSGGARLIDEHGAFAPKLASAAAAAAPVEEALAAMQQAPDACPGAKDLDITDIFSFLK